MPESYSSLANAGFGLALGLTVLYFILRGTAWRPGGDPVHSVRVHAMITALIALFASGTAGYYRLVPWGEASPLPWAEALVTVSGPPVGLVLIYVVAQYTWPRQTGPVRTARLADRRAGQYLPRALSAVALGVSLLAAAAVALAWTTPAVQMQDVNGFRPGTVFAPWLLAALALMIAGFLVVLRVVARRPPLGGLHPHDDHLVRQITVNRALRTVVLMLWGVANAAVQGWAQAYHAVPQVPPLVEVLESAAGITGAVLMLAMLLWRSPALRELGDHTVTGRLPARPGHELGRPGTVEAVRRLRRESITVAWVAGIIIAGVFALPVLDAAVGGHPAWGALPFATVLLVFGVYEFAIRRGHCPPVRVAPSVSGTTPRWTWWALGLSLVLAGAWCLLSLAAPVPQTGLATSLAVTAGVLAAGAVGCSRLALRRPPLGRATAAQDEAIRSAGAERLLAVGAAGITTVTAIACFVSVQVWMSIVLAGLAVVFLLGPAGRAASTEAAEPAELPVLR